MPPKPKTEAEKAQIRTNIMDAARTLFVNKGIDAVTMREIAKQVNYSPTALYLHFKDKATLIEALCATDFQSLASELNQILAIENAVQRMIALGGAYAQFALSYPNHYRMMFMTARPEMTMQASASDPSLDAYRLLNQVVKDVYEQGYFLASLTQPELIAQTIWAGIHGVCALQITMGHEQHMQWCDIMQRVKLMQITLIRGLLNHPNIEGILK